MNKKMRELLSQISEKTELAKSYMDGENKDVAKANEVLDEIDTLQKEYETEGRIYNMEKEENRPSEVEVKAKSEVNITKKFADGVRAVIKKDFNVEGVDANGGYTVPEEIITKVERFRETEESLMDLVSVKTVKTNKGQETYKNRGDYTGFTSVGEGGKLPKAGKLKFSRLEWNIAKYGGYMPVSNELLEDSDENIEALMVEWLGNESRVTRNNLILTTIKNSESQPYNFHNIDALKASIIGVLGSAFRATSKIITNDTGLAYLDMLKDENGRYLLNPDPTNPAKLQLRCGNVVIPLVVYSNATLPCLDDEGTQIPFIVGDLKEGIKFFDRKQLNIMVSNTAVVGEGEEALNAFEEDLTIIRGIEREDCVVRDKSAYMYGYIDTSVVEG